MSPATSKVQQQAAGAELSRRRRGVKRQPSGKTTRPFGSASLSDLKEFAGTRTKRLPTRKTAKPPSRKIKRIKRSKVTKARPRSPRKSVARRRRS